jgi:hypothetical protein
VGDAGVRTSALARAEAALAAKGAPGSADPAGSAAPADPGAEDERPGAEDGTPPRRGRRRAVLVASVVAAVLVLGGGGAYLVTRDGGGTAAAPPDVVLPSPTATAAPVARAATTPFASALPASVLQYALQGSADDADWLGQGAVEAYAETYSDGADGTVTVQAGQWETPEEAAAVLAAVTATLPAAPADATDPAAEDAAGAEPSADPTADPGAAAVPAVLRTGEVLVDGQPTGTVTVVDAGDGTGVAAWSNGTTVFRVTGPAADIANLYAAYPL